MNFQTLTLKKHMFDIFSSHSFKSNYKYIILSDETIVCTDVKGTPGFIHCSFKVASLATLNKQMLSSLATYNALSLVITKPSFIWFGSTSVEIVAVLVNKW